ncbi:MAG: hypothetical protein Q4D41_04695 [Prevotellaceae bacterium]|nr:hypothetical protein [Prevotellaceae bacterium]
MDDFLGIYTHFVYGAISLLVGVDIQYRIYKQRNEVRHKYIGYLLWLIEAFMNTKYWKNPLKSKLRYINLMIFSVVAICIGLFCIIFNQPYLIHLSQIIMGMVLFKEGCERFRDGESSFNYVTGAIFLGLFFLFIGIFMFLFEDLKL